MKNIVTIGGGTGSFTLLSGLKKYPINISAIVSMADDGGSTGRLRDELGVLPPGDIRQCLVALSNSSDTLRELMNYRFKNGDLKGHNFGNLLLSALEKIQGNFSLGVKEATNILGVKGQVIPVSEDEMNLYIKLKNNKILIGEKQLDHNKDVRKYGIKKVYLNPVAKANKDAIEAIKKADIIVIGPGDHYGSIIPNLLVMGISEAIRKSKAKVIYNCNLTNKKGQTEEFDVDKYVKEMNRYLGSERIDFVIFPFNKPTEDLQKKYEKREGRNSVVKFNKDNLIGRNYKVVRADVLNKVAIKKNKEDKIADTRSFIRHDSDRLANVILSISEMENEKLIKEVI
ncbi:MAG: hypothetical protein UR51_C0002G0123 [Candidatus Moranbacteria bacterium GW2011_GWF1_34_10]|nr:MAG: hypothetical protein UR51_C0002G0123 [Candidatus Moranbacteria bacterium GW2011_GWF1_34_10]